MKTPLILPKKEEIAIGLYGLGFIVCYYCKSFLLLIALYAIGAIIIFRQIKEQEKR